jgi:beta-lactamase regulating signal transducer with metallopeptidase domain
LSGLQYDVFGFDPLATLVAALLLINLVGGATVLLVAIARLLARRAFGPAAAYWLWLIPPLAMAATLLVVFTPSQTDHWSPAAIVAILIPWLGRLAPVWALGVVGLGALFALAQARFMTEVRAGRAGPAVVGLISPRVVLPTDDGRYTPEERELIRAHERAHVARKDPRGAALVALFQCLCWFNPIAHLAAYLVRLDQELACDAAVMMSRPEARGLYARTLLKTQLASAPLPLGCYWPARGTHPLEVRIGLLKRRVGKAAPRPTGSMVVLASVDAIRP